LCVYKHSKIGGGLKCNCNFALPLFFFDANFKLSLLHEFGMDSLEI
jgi:hypothetical protein